VDWQNRRAHWSLQARPQVVLSERTLIAQNASPSISAKQESQIALLVKAQRAANEPAAM
jgi:hypothetical protein